MKSYITAFKKHETNRILPQDQGIAWLSRYHGEDFYAAFEKYSVNPDYIKARAVYADGIGDLPIDSNGPLYQQDEEYSPLMNQRSESAQNMVRKIFEDLYKDEFVAPCAVNHVSCTHYQSPSGAQEMIVGKEWFDKTTVTHLYHMGCYASLPAIRTSKAMISDGRDRVDVVHTELCSFHLDKEDISAEQIIMRTLFADGAIKYGVVSEDGLKKTGEQSAFEVLGQKEVMVPGSENEMSWKIGAKGFSMTLTKKVPFMLARNIKKFMTSMFDEAGLSYEDSKEDAIFAVHPGGPKIIELVQKVLELKDEQVAHSKKVLESRGNMSSATLPFIWSDLLNDQSLTHNKIVASVAFGPGLTMTGVIFKTWKS